MITPNNMITSNMITPLFEKLDNKMVVQPQTLTPEMKQQSDDIFKKTNLNLKSGEKEIIINYALWLMPQITDMINNKKGGMLTLHRKHVPRTQSIVPSAQSIVPRTPDDLDYEGKLHSYIRQTNQQRRRERERENTPSMSKIFLLCILFGIGLYLIYDSYNRLINLAGEINDKISEKDEFVQILNDVLLKPPENSSSDGGFMYHAWNYLAKTVGLNRMPTSSDTGIVTQRILAEMTRSASHELKISLAECGYTTNPNRMDYPEGIAGQASYLGALAIAQSTNLVAGVTPVYCAATRTTTMYSLRLNKFIAENTIFTTTLISKITIIKNLMSYALYVLGIAVPGTIMMIRKVINSTSDDIALLDYREEIKEIEEDKNDDYNGGKRKVKSKKNKRTPKKHKKNKTKKHKKNGTKKY